MYGTSKPFCPSLFGTPTMTRTILIGKGRRITLDELYAISNDGANEVRLEMAQPDVPQQEDGAAAPTPSIDTTDKHLSSALSRLVLSLGDRGSMLSRDATKAALVLLSLTICQGGVIRSKDCGAKYELATKVVELINFLNGSGESVQLPRDPTAFAQSLTSFLGCEICPPDLFLVGGEGKVAKAFLGRLISLARIALSLSLARTLASKSVSDAIASLTFERLSNKYRQNPNLIMSLDSYSSMAFDELRPHRGCIESAAVMRACLQGSSSISDGGNPKGSNGSEEFVAITEEDKKAVKYTLTVPQYHGPAREAILAACKTIELELNCSEASLVPSVGVGRDGVWDDTVAVLAAQSATNGVDSLVFGSLSRAGSSVENTTHGNTCNTLNGVASSLEKSAVSLQSALENEAQLGCLFVSDELSKKDSELKAKESEKAKRAAERMECEGSASVSAPAGDEFAGMTEAQKAKILKKRSEKEAKAAAKRKAKEAKAAGGEAALTSLFGAGTALIYPLLTSSGSANIATSRSVDLSNKHIIAQLEKNIESLLSGGLQRKPKVPKGTRDYLPEQMAIRDEAFSIIRRVFKRHGAVEIDTPVFELKETLTGKYGEDSKLIYDLADQGGELLALRYDLTVPFARFLAVNAVGNIKRFHIGKVYRRDQPALSRGRYREFYQCDFDIAGVYGRMVPDSECLAVACEILDALPIGDFGIKLNHRRLLDAILDLCGVPAEKFRTICSAVDKLDKEPWSEVRREMVEDKGLTSDVADRIGEFVVLKGEPWEMYDSLMRENKFGDHKGAMEAMEDMRILFEYLEAMDKLNFISFDLSLARGLDYYTGVIYEAVCMNGNTQVGSIGGGGRYDNLVSMFQEAGKVTPCVGVSVGIERVFTLMEERLRQQQGGSIKQPNVSVLVASAGGDGQIHHRMKLANLLWAANISAEFNQQESPKLKFEIANALERDIPFMVIVGEEEAREGKCKVKDLRARTEETVETKHLVAVLREKGVVPVGCEFAMELLNE